MENTDPRMDPDEARTLLDEATLRSSRLAGSLELPSYFHVSIGAAVAVQIATTAWALTADHAYGWVVLAVGLAVFLAVAAIQLARFRRLNGAWVSGLVSQAVLGSSALSSIVYALGISLAVWAGFADLTWLLLVVAIAAGVAYAEAGRRWWSAYRADPGGRARGLSGVEVAALTTFSIAALVLLVAYR